MHGHTHHHHNNSRNNGINIGSGNPTTTSSASNGTGTADADDLDNAKYDTSIKRRLRRQKRRSSSSTTSLGATARLVVVAVTSFVVTAVYVSYQHHAGDRALHTAASRLSRASALVKERHASLFRSAAEEAEEKHRPHHPRPEYPRDLGGQHHDHHRQQREDPEAHDDPHRHDDRHHRRPPRAVEYDENAMSSGEYSKSHSTGHTPPQSTQSLQRHFARLLQERKEGNGNDDDDDIHSERRTVLNTWLDRQNDGIVHNEPAANEPLWIRPYLLPPLPGSDWHPQQDAEQKANLPPLHHHGRNKRDTRFFRVDRASPDEPMAWLDDYDRLVEQHQHGGSDETATATLPGPLVDYTDASKYVVPDLLERPPVDGSYPPLQPLQTMLTDWPQDEDQPGTIHEGLQHFNFSNPAELAMARRFRDAELPFKLYDIPEFDAAGIRWTDDYVSSHFVRDHGPLRGNHNADHVPPASGLAQESPNHYFAFFTAKQWDPATMGLAPTRNNDWDYDTWSKHARYADAVRLTPDRPHFYWQSGVDAAERYRPRDKWCFIGRDLPSFSATQENFFVFHPEEQKGIQCRFGERGVVAATHFDGGRNMVGMILGAKRYILSPPNQCSKLGIFTEKRSPIYRHSLLNFGHIQYKDDRSNGMSDEERAWLDRAAQSRAISTVLRKGQVLYIPSHWFHYIVSLQKSAQCNVRSGIDREGTERFGSRKDVEECVD